jgi:psiF repeat-containing protein
MRLLIATLCLAFAATGAFAQDKKEPTAAQKKQQERMKACNDKAGDKKGEERKKFMSACLKGEAAGASAAQKERQSRMKDCNKQASDKKLKGDERKKFMSACLKG